MGSTLCATHFFTDGIAILFFTQYIAYCNINHNVQDEMNFVFKNVNVLNII